MPDRNALPGIVLVLHAGCSWRQFSEGLGRGSSATCWRRLRDWQARPLMTDLRRTAVPGIHGPTSFAASQDPLHVNCHDVRLNLPVH